MGDRPTAAQRADAADRLTDALDAVLSALRGTRAIVSEGRPKGQTYGTPFFPFIGDKIEGHLDAARDALWDAGKIVAVQGYTDRRAAEKEAEPDA